MFCFCATARLVPNYNLFFVTTQYLLRDKHTFICSHNTLFKLQNGSSYQVSLLNGDHPVFASRFKKFQKKFNVFYRFFCFADCHNLPPSVSHASMFNLSLTQITPTLPTPPTIRICHFSRSSFSSTQSPPVTLPISRVLSSAASSVTILFTHSPPVTQPIGRLFQCCLLRYYSPKSALHLRSHVELLNPFPVPLLPQLLLFNFPANWLEHGTAKFFFTDSYLYFSKYCV